jgi:hypothetical protein
MKQQLELIKQEISNFINLTQESNIEFDKGLPYFTYINSYLFELQSHLRKELEKRSVNLNLNPSIYSEEISNSMLKERPLSYTKKTDKDLMFPFLYYLCENYNGQDKLVDYIEGFTSTYSNQLVWEDIVMTQSGATRIYTNLRFALNQLRNIGLVRREDEKGKTDVEPSVLGYLFYMVIGMKEENKGKNQILKYEYYSIYNSLIEFKDALKEHDNHKNIEIKYPKLYYRYRENLHLIADAFNELFIKTSIFKDSGISIPDKLFEDPLYLKLLGLIK